MSLYHFVVAYAACALDLFLYFSLLAGDPGFVTACSHLHSAAHLDHLPTNMILIASSESLPGTFPLSASPPIVFFFTCRVSVDYCSVCHSCRPLRSHHCRRCGRCVNRMDHHCPWIGKCVGARNLRHFCLYLLYTLLLSAFGLHITWNYLFLVRMHTATCHTCARTTPCV